MPAPSKQPSLIVFSHNNATLHSVYISVFIHVSSAKGAGEPRQVEGRHPAGGEGGLGRHKRAQPRRRPPSPRRARSVPEFGIRVKSNEGAKSFPKQTRGHRAPRTLRRPALTRRAGWCQVAARAPPPAGASHGRSCLGSGSPERHLTYTIIW